MVPNFFRWGYYPYTLGQFFFNWLLKILKFLKSSHVIPQTILKALLGIFLTVLSGFRNNFMVFDVFVQGFKTLRKYITKIWLRHHHVTDHFRKKSLFFRDTRDHLEYDTKVRSAISSPSFSEVQKKIPQKTIGPCGMINASATTTTLKSSCFESNLIVIMR